MYDWEVDVQRYYVETGRFNKKGKPIMRPVTVRRLYVTGDAVGTSGCHRICARGGKFTLSTKRQSEQSKWTNPEGKIAAWWEVEDGYTRDVKEPAWTKQECISWLEKRIGADAMKAVHCLVTAEPMNRQMAA